MSIRDRFFQVFGIRIQGEKWSPYVDMMDRNGYFTRKTELSLLIHLCEAVEALENGVKENDAVSSNGTKHPAKKSVQSLKG